MKVKAIWIRVTADSTLLKGVDRLRPRGKSWLTAKDAETNGNNKNRLSADEFKLQIYQMVAKKSQKILNFNLELYIRTNLYNFYKLFCINYILLVF